MTFVTFAYDGRSPRVGLLMGEDHILDLGLALLRNRPKRMPIIWGRDMAEFIGGGDMALDWARSVAAAPPAGCLVPVAEAHIMAPIPYPRKNIFCVGLNYRDHVAEHDRQGSPPRPVPEAPAFFTKPPTAIVGPGEDILWHRATTKLDYEIELGVIISRLGRDIKASTAWDYVFGYTVINDVTARDLQRAHGGQWFKGKALDGQCPMGPAIVHASAVPNPADLDFECRVNGELRQKSNTGLMIFSIPKLIESLSAGMTLEPGDILATGTCSGVGSGFEPPRFLGEGDVVELKMEQVGVLRNKVRRAMP